MANRTIDHALTGERRSLASDPTHAGVISFARRRYAKNVSGADVAVLGIPFDAATSNRPGARFGPRAVRAASTIMDNDPQYPFHDPIFDRLDVVDAGDVLLDYGDHASVSERIEDAANAIIGAGTKCLAIGGDHFVTYPLLRAHAERHGSLALVQFDAHQDTWDDDGERIDHGTFVARAVADGIVDAASSIQIGIRTHAPDDCGIEIVYGDELDEMRAADVAARIRGRVGERTVYVTFDIDCLDPAYAPGTGTPVPGGPSSAKMLGTLRKLDGLNIVGADVVEVAPAYDHAEITAIAASAVAMHYCGLWLAAKERT